jgi:anaphase-promoting complex subunit 3
MSNKTDISKLRQLVEAGNYITALTLANQLLKELPDNIEYLILTATIHRELHNTLEVIKWMSKAVRLAPDNISNMLIYASDLLRAGHLNEAEETLKQIERVQPNHLKLLLTQGDFLYESRQFEAAINKYIQILKIKPELALAHFELAHTLLMRGDWIAGWREYEWRYKLPHTKSRFPEFQIPHWNGMKHPAHVLLIADQGYGDSIQFSRYIPLVADYCGKVSLIRSRPLSTLLDTVPGITTSYEHWEDIKDIDAHSTLSELPRLFNTTKNTIPDCRGLFKTTESNRQRWLSRIQDVSPDAKLRIGIAWSGRTEFKNNFLRSLSTELIEPLISTVGAQFFSLQVGDTAYQANSLNVVNLSSELTDFSETASAMQALDLIITSDTSIAHLAGSLGVPTWLLLSRAPDWRWDSEGKKCLWYPSLHLFRQDESRSWSTVVTTVKDCLTKIVSSDQAIESLEIFMQRP